MAQSDITIQQDIHPRAPDVSAAEFLRRVRAMIGTTPVERASTLGLWAMYLLYAAFFIVAEWQRYDHFLMHSLDMGNMEQAAWNTAHGYPFRFTNLRFPEAVEVSGTSTRLSFHVEPIFLLLAIPYLFVASPVVLMVIQTLVVASGIFPAAWLARRYLKLPLAQLAFPLAYLLAPPLQAANLYEFHPVTLSAAFLLWALYFADGAQYRLFAVFAILAASTKEEIGLVVGLIGLWIWWRHRDRTLGLTTAILGVGWTLICFFVIMRHFSNGHGSPYCARLNPFRDVSNGPTNDPEVKVTSCLGVAKIFLHHPDQLVALLTMTQKLGFLHRMFVTAGYLSLLSPVTLAISLPSYALIMLSSDEHMYSGLGHYPAELVPLLIGSAIIGTAWLANTVGPRVRVRPAIVTGAACLWLLMMSVANTRVNGFTPIAEGFALPQETHHDQVGHRVLAMIPPGVPVTSGDYLNPHLSDRAESYLIPDVGDARYAVFDVSRDNFPLSTTDETNYIRDNMLRNPQDHSKRGDWGIAHAEDGYIVLERWADNPHLSATLPQQFYTFIVPDPQPVRQTIEHPLVVDFGPSLQLLGYKIERREEVNLRLPDVLLTTYWQRTGPITTPITPVVYLTNAKGSIDVFGTDHPAINWLPTTQWPRGKIVTVQSVPLTVATNDNGPIDVDLAVCDLSVANPLTCTDPHYRPRVLGTPGHVPMEVVGPGTILKLTQLPVHW